MLDEAVREDGAEFLKIVNSPSFQPDQDSRHCLRFIFRLAVRHSEGFYDERIYAPGRDLSKESRDAWDRLRQDHPELIGDLLECCRLKPPSFRKILSLGA